MTQSLPYKKLRTGFTTGACVTAAASVAYRALYDCNYKGVKKISILFPDNKSREIKILKIYSSKNSIKVFIKKDAGDDIDITNNAIISVTLSKFSEKLLDSDIILSTDNLTIVLRRGDGVGIATTDMLDIPNGKIAITPTPQKMIVENLKKIFMENNLITDSVLIIISIKDGVSLAKRTLNSTLGVQDGLSILGTSGIVIPCSHDAYKTTIEMLIKGAARSIDRTVVAVTGGKTHRLIKDIIPNFPEERIIRIGDFIEETIKKSAEYNLLGLTVGCMPGKLAKYSLGYGYTHANTVRTEMESIANILKENSVGDKVISRINDANSIREFILGCSYTEQKKIFEIWAKLALENFSIWNGDIELKIVLFGFESELCGEWDNGYKN